jgi:LPXTG-site transpeptidase (sortase) family protein
MAGERSSLILSATMHSRRLLTTPIGKDSIVNYSKPRRFLTLCSLFLCNTFLCNAALSDNEVATAMEAEEVEAPWFAYSAPDQSDWSKKRISRFALVDYQALGEPVAMISIPDLEVSVPVFPDTTPFALEAGAAWVSGTSSPSEAGNMAVAGHRDSFFRSLEGIPLGTPILLATTESEQIYIVDSVDIVDALDIRPLDATDSTRLTLITCHPFRYHGFAPDRYIVRAVLVNDNRQVEKADSRQQRPKTIF